MLSSKNGSKKTEYCCDQCSTVNGKKHPTLKTIVHLRKQIIGGRLMTLCQECTDRVKQRSRHNNFERTRAPSIERVKNSVHHLFNP